MGRGRFVGKVAVVTGAARGIGAAVVRALIAEGARVVGGDISEDGLTDLGTELGADFAGVRADVTSEREVAALVAAAAERFGGLDVAFNVAGAAKAAPLLELSESDWDFTVDLVLKGVFLSTKHEARLMRERGGGAIVNVSSLNAHVPLLRGSPYASGKAGVEMFGKNAALELAPFGVRVNTVLPGLVDTPLVARVLGNPQRKAAFVERIPLGRPATPEEIALPALFLASSEAAYITGTSLVIDGGWEITGYPDVSRLA